MILAVALLLQAAPVPDVAPQDRRAFDRALTRRLSRSGLVLPNTEVRTVMVDPIATCLQKQASKDTERFLSTSLISPEEYQRGVKLLEKHRSCLGQVRSITMPIPRLRGALAQRRLLNQTTLLDTFASRSPQKMNRVPAVEGRPFLVLYATCLTMSQPAWAAALLRTPTRSAAEKRQFAQFGSTLNDCMPVDRSYNVDIPALRDEMAAVVDRMIASGDGAKNA